jgi:tetratricopeptide (TPR) repeat protein
LLDELGRLADQTLRHADLRDERGYADALFYAGMRAWYVGDWERTQQVVSAGIEADPDSPSILGLSMGVAAMHGDLAAAVAIGEAAVEQARRPNHPGCLSFMLSLLALAELGVDPVRALTHAEEAVDVARRSPAPSMLIYPLCQLSIAAQQNDPDRALAAAEECVRLDQTHRKAWSTLSEGSAAKLRVERGELATGLRLWRDVLLRLHWSGEVAYLSLQLPGLADSIAGIDPTLALELAAISESGAIAPFATFDALTAFERLAHTVDELGPDALHAARSRAASMSYDEALEYVVDNINRLITDTAHDQRRVTPSS